MALSLTAEQKNISSLFYNEDQYIIPEFQRPYCWTNETSYQLYTDIMTYYYAQEDFFVGNIVWQEVMNTKISHRLLMVNNV